MSVNLEVKGTLAKLLATEDLIVEHKSVSTASFNVQTRVLTLPRWERASSNVVDMLIAHEVGHALFTPNEDWRKKTSVPMAFINVTEDVRIENLMKQKFSGLPKTFYKGYHELHDQDFFGLEDEDVNAMNIADRVNLYFKVGNFIDVQFSDAEKPILKQINAARTFDEAIAAAEALYALHQVQKEEQEQQKSEEQVSAKEDQEQEASGQEPGESQQPEFGDGEMDSPQNETDETGEEQGDSEETGEGEESEEEVEEEKAGGGTTSGDLNDTVQTMDNLNDALESLTSNSSFGEPMYVTYPKTDLDYTVAKNEEVHTYIQESFEKQIAYFQEHCGERADRIIHQGFGIHQEKFAKFKREIQSEVNYMVKEFECKKSAAAYARAATSRTGVLDCTKLHTYKYNDDIFKKITTLPEGKNHGLVFILDWSGSMCDILEDTMKQLLSLVMFCDKVGIPFDVYAFTNEWHEPSYESRRNENLEQAGVFYISKEFALMNVLTSKVNRKQLQKQMETMYIIASSYSTRSFDIVPRRVGLSGTPLNEALIVLRDLLPKFKTENKVEKAHVMVLTDGEAAGVRCTKHDNYSDDEKIIVGRFYGNAAYLRNRATGMVTKVEQNGISALTTALLEDLRVQFPESTFTGFRILESRGGWFIRQATGYDENLQKKWKKEKSIALTNFGYNKYFVVSSNSLQQTSEFEVDDDASKAKIKSAFAKSLKGKKNNKKILGDFIGLIA